MPSNIGDLVQKVISRNSPKKIEVKAGKRIYSVAFHPLPDKKCVNIYGFDISEQKELEEKLRESEVRFRSAFDDSAVAMALVDQDARIPRVNDAFCRMLGFEKSEIEGHSFLDFTYPDDMKPSILAHKAVINNEKPFLWIEKRYIRKDGRVIWCDVSSSPVLDAKGCPIYTVAHIQDITERKKAEEILKKAHDSSEEKVKERTTELEKAYISLKESEEGLAEAQRIAHLGSWDWNIVTNGLYWSDEMYCIFGRNPQEFGATYDEFLSCVHPDDRDNVDNTIKKGLNGKPHGIDYRIVLADGEERTVHTQTEVIFDDENTPVQLKGITQDVTERKKAEEKIQNLANIVESSNDAIITKSFEDIITSWNKGAEQIYGYSAEEVLGRPISILEPDILKGEIKRLDKMIKQGEKIHNYETSRLRKDGTIIDISITLSPVFDASGKLVSISAIARDITGRKKAEEALANIETARKKEIHHRIKNNLQVISSLLDLQAEQFKNKENIKDSEVLEVFRESQDRVISMALIHEELHEGEGGDTVSFSTYLEKLADNLFQTYRLRNTDISLNMDLEDNLFFDTDTAIPLGMIVNELVSNSFKHAFIGRDEGEIRIKLCSEKSVEFESEDCESTSFTLTISDNGVGIPELDIEDLDSLGLQIVTSLVDQLDGELELKRNDGTEFTIRFILTENNNQTTTPAHNN